MKVGPLLAASLARHAGVTLLALAVAVLASGLTFSSAAAAAAVGFNFDSSANPSVFGQSPINLTVTIAPADGNGPVPTGTITIYVDGNPVEQGSLSPTGFFNDASTTVDISLDLGLGPNDVTAIYSGDSTYPTQGSQDPGVNQIVNPDNTTTAVASSANPSVTGQSVTFTSTTSPVSPGNATCTGSVTFSADGVVQGTVALDSKGHASLTTSALAAGHHEVRALYGDSTVCNGSTSSMNQDVNQATPPVITAVSPRSGPTAGGTTITITGKNFTPATTVRMGGTGATTVVVGSSTSITAHTPSKTGGTVDVQVTTNSGPSALSAADRFAYGPPVVTSLSPSSGTTAGGAVVTLTGSAFVSGETVSFGSVAASAVTVLSATQMRATAPGGVDGTVVAVTVTNAVGTSTASAADAYTYHTPPTVTAVNPTSGPTAGSTVITITGTHFAAPASVLLGGVAATGVVVVSATKITAHTPAHAGGTVNVQVAVGAVSSALSATDRFAYGPPLVTSLSPPSGSSAGGTVITVTGSAFLSGETVRFGTVAATAVTVLSATQLRATAPAAPAGTAVHLTVTSPQGTSATSAADLYTYHTPPQVTAVSPRAGVVTGGTAITITGTNFTSPATVSIGGAAATSVVVVSATQIRARSPAHLAGIVDVQVTTAGGPSSLSSADRYMYGPPAVSGLSVHSGPHTGGTVVTVTGTGFMAGDGVRFGGVAGTSVTIISPTQLTVTAPPGTAGATVDVTVTNPAGTSATSTADFFTYS